MASDAVPRLLEQSQWVIEGTVQKVGASTMSEVPASANTFVVKVDGIIHGPPEFADHRGREITLYSESPQGLAVKRSAVFFTRSWLYGQSLAVIEVGRIPKGRGETVARNVKAAEQAHADRRLAERIAKASLVVAGEVADTKQGPELKQPIETEHHPEWATAVFKVGDVLKGQPRGSTVDVVYPKSLDELWIDSPKLEPGTTGILILQRNQKEKGWTVMRVPGLTALDPLDHQPLEELDRVRRLAEGAR